MVLVRCLGNLPLQGETVAGLALEPAWLHLLPAVVLETSTFQPPDLCLSPLALLYCAFTSLGSHLCVFSIFSGS